MILKRSDAYIGVLIDDLVTKETHEPYRMMTSRAEYRLLLRQDNADLRLTEIGHEIGLIDDERYEKLLLKKQMIKDEIDRVSGINIGAGKANNDFLEASGSTALKTAATLAELIRRPELDYAMVAPLDPDRKPLPYDVINQVEISIKYEGCIKRQMSQVEKVLKLENKRIPEDIDYREIHGLRIEAMQKLEKIRPFSIGQASRISGVSPADISVLLIYMTQYGRKDRETV